jgi:hypothetical protein
MHGGKTKAIEGFIPVIIFLDKSGRLHLHLLRLIGKINLVDSNPRQSISIFQKGLIAAYQGMVGKYSFSYT